MLLHLSGVEALTLELGGTLPERRGRELAGPRLALELRDGQVGVSLLVFRMRGLRPVDLPGAPLDYDEALWRVGVLHEGRPAWLAATCDVDRPLVRVLGRTFIRYPVRPAAISIEAYEKQWRARVGEGSPALVVEGTETTTRPAPVPPRRVLVREGDALYEIPWREDPAPHRCEAEISVVLDTLSEPTFGAPAAWDGRGLVHRGRVHHCGVARRIR